MSKSVPLSFSAFQATRRWCDDLGKALSDARWDDAPARARGNLYLGGLFIEEVREPNWTANLCAKGKWHLLIERDETISDDLGELERQLWQWAVSAGYDQDSARQALIAEYATWQAAHGLSLGSAAEHTEDENLTEAQRAALRDFCVRWEDMEHHKNGIMATPSSPDDFYRREEAQHRREIMRRIHELATTMIAFGEQDMGHLREDEARRFHRATFNLVKILEGWQKETAQ